MQPARADRFQGTARLGSVERRLIREWAESYDFSPFRNYPYISSDQAVRVIEDAILEQRPGVYHLWLRDSAEPVGLMRIESLPWDTELYRRRMGRITHVCGDIGAHDVRRLVDMTDFEHLAVRVDASDIRTQRTLTAAGFFPADTLLTYLYIPGNGEIPAPPPTRSNGRYTFRPYEPADREAILDITRHSYKRYPGRYHTDPWLQEQSAERYFRWARKCVDGEADQICVSEANGRVAGFVAFRYDRSLYKVLGIGSYGSGLGAARGGDYLRLLRYTLMCDKAIPWQFAECDTQIDNYHVHRIYHALRLEYVRAENTYHLHRA